MGFEWNANVSVAYVQRVEWIGPSGPDGYWEFDRRCLKLLQARPGRKRAKDLRGEPFTEEKAAAMSPDH